MLEERAPPCGDGTARPAKGGGLVVWLTGYPAAGKTTIAAALSRRLEKEGVLVETLDGDVARTHLSAGLGFSRSDRQTNVLRIGWVASRLARAGATVVVAVIAPYADDRAAVRAMTEEHATFFEVHVATPLEECIRRDPKGMYRRALAGEIRAFTGVSDPYEVPVEPDLELDTSAISPDEAAAVILARIGARRRLGVA